MTAPQLRYLEVHCSCLFDISILQRCSALESLILHNGENRTGSGCVVLTHCDILVFQRLRELKIEARRLIAPNFFGRLSTLSDKVLEKVHLIVRDMEASNFVIGSLCLSHALRAHTLDMRKAGFECTLGR